MKTKLILLISLLTIGFVSCDDEKKTVDPIYEFVSFNENPSVNLNELDNSTEGYPVVVQLWAFKPYKEDITVTLEVTASDATEGVDFTVSPGTTITIPKGKLVSDPIIVKTIDNDNGTDADRRFDLKLKSVSNSDIKVGLGLTNPTNNVVTFHILDDECSNPTSIFNADLTNTLNWGGSDIDKPITGELAGDELTVTGDLIDYGGFTGAALTITLTPEAPGATKGTATFGVQYMGVADDGYEYQFEQVGTGTFDTCSGTVSVEYDIYYMDGGSWVYWYTVTNVYHLP
jgi:hypothetical protein